jgi:hypothetical protein
LIRATRPRSGGNQHCTARRNNLVTSHLAILPEENARELLHTGHAPARQSHYPAATSPSGKRVGHPLGRYAPDANLVFAFTNSLFALR